MPRDPIMPTNHVPKCPAFIINKTVQKYPLRSQSVGRGIFITKHSNLTHIINKKHAEVSNRIMANDSIDNQSVKHASIKVLSMLFQPSTNKYEIERSTDDQNSQYAKEISRTIEDDSNTYNNNRKCSTEANEKLPLFRKDSIPHVKKSSPLEALLQKENYSKPPLVNHYIHDPIEKNVEMLLAGSISEKKLNSFFEEYKKIKFQLRMDKLKDKQSDKENLPENIKILHDQPIQNIDEAIIEILVKKLNITPESILNLTCTSKHAVYPKNKEQINTTNNQNEKLSLNFEINTDIDIKKKNKPENLCPQIPERRRYKRLSNFFARIEEDNNIEVIRFSNGNIKHEIKKSKERSETTNDTRIENKFKEPEEFKDLTITRDSQPSTTMNALSENFFITSPKISNNNNNSNNNVQETHISSNNINSKLFSIPPEIPINNFRIQTTTARPNIQQGGILFKRGNNNCIRRRERMNSVTNILDQSSNNNGCNNSSQQSIVLKDIHSSVINIVNKCMEYSHELIQNEDSLNVELKEIENKAKKEYNTIEECNQTANLIDNKDQYRMYKLKREFKKKLVKKLMDSIVDKKQVIYSLKTEYFEEMQRFEKLTLQDVIIKKCEKNLGF